MSWICRSSSLGPCRIDRPNTYPRKEPLQEITTFTVHFKLCRHSVWKVNRKGVSSHESLKTFQAKFLNIQVALKPANSLFYQLLQ